MSPQTSKRTAFAIMTAITLVLASLIGLLYLGV
jgi:hypothetical protein